MAERYGPNPIFDTCGCCGAEHDFALLGMNRWMIRYSCRTWVNWNAHEDRIAWHKRCEGERGQ